MKKMRAFFSWEPRPPQAGERIFSVQDSGLGARQADKHWVRGQPPSGVNAGLAALET